MLLEVEDNDAELVRLMLQREVEAQFEVTRVRCLADAVKLTVERSFDVLIVDLLVPDARGLEVVETLAPLAPHDPIVVLTGVDDEGARDAALRLGAAEFVTKLGVSPVTLGRSVLFAVQRKRAAAEYHVIMEDAAAEERDLDALVRGLESLRSLLGPGLHAGQRCRVIMDELQALCRRCADRSARRHRQLRQSRGRSPAESARSPAI